MVPWKVTSISDGVLLGEEWSIHTVNVRNMLNSRERDELCEQLQIPLPDMLFGKNKVVLNHRKRNFDISFCATSALSLVDKTGESLHVRVHASEEWKRARRHCLGLSIVRPYDWTFTTFYQGDVLPNSFQFNDTEERIDYESLKLPDPILFYDDVLLFQDELGDFGMSSLSVKVRVMPSSFFLLQRFFSRVDGVIVRVVDTRLYHQFGTSFACVDMLREFVYKEASYEEISKTLPISSEPSLCTNINLISEHLTTVQEQFQKLSW